ncbi:hypothetical protein BE04_39665 [Sorangium cellulosum]|uniref:Uncharacterized protein n=1 Tax=Sorangium cellulosum TaxID=56 RepID=A0A150PH72_SORCE|nr:hypothetical protein BE04_39665 [Sorangium cellulosum]
MRGDLNLGGDLGGDLNLGRVGDLNLGDLNLGDLNLGRVDLNLGRAGGSGSGRATWRAHDFNLGRVAGATWVGSPGPRRGSGDSTLGRAAGSEAPPGSDRGTRRNVGTERLGIGYAPSPSMIHHPGHRICLTSWELLQVFHGAVIPRQGELLLIEKDGCESKYRVERVMYKMTSNHELIATVFVEPA